ncbi:MAG: dihydroorotase [Bacteroidia bacterium]|nr:dihydroorotase [Bacteroidia bacterium]MDW8157303.1 dihydroorotase [Bacteroidia bacterium]
MTSLLIRNAKIVNENSIEEKDVFIQGNLIHTIGTHLKNIADITIEGQGLYLLPGLIDDQVHFREPGFTYKGSIWSESRAAIAGGVTTYMEMPNTFPPTTTIELLEEKYKIAAQNSFANYSFFLGATNDNLSELLKLDLNQNCGVKVFMGSSTGSLLVDSEEALEAIFSQVPALIATHCEDENTIKNNMLFYTANWGEKLCAEYHPQIRSRQACWLSTYKAIQLAQKYNTRLHVLHISTQEELNLFNNKIPISEKRITAEACIHHLWFSKEDYAQLGNLIKWNPAIKNATDREALRKAVRNNTIDVIATDHAPHALEEKQQPYISAPSGGPLVQHALLALLELHKKGVFTLEEIVNKTSHNVAICFKIQKRGFIREGYYADLVLVDLNTTQKVTKKNLLYHCQWSPFEGQIFNSTILYTILNGQIVYHNGKILGKPSGKRIEFYTSQED